ncbi:hypothetical protein [Arthrobacter castelli]|uniref:hypothetical protein n=1 Tax=Arthrobacter castelli TaxID=271431 RepID=UPI0004003000|nr:hypothetical protein [Arthrobacter castelli]
MNKNANNTTDSTDEKLSAELGMDVGFVEQQINFRLDLARMQRGEPAELGYILIDRRHNPDAAIVFAGAKDALTALEDHLLVNDLRQENCLDARVPDRANLSDLAGRQIILP